MQADAVPWIQFASEDLRMAKLAVTEGLTAQTCFHSQQCCEKLLKGILSSRGSLPPRTHKIVDLLVQLHLFYCNAVPFWRKFRILQPI